MKMFVGAILNIFTTKMYAILNLWKTHNSDLQLVSWYWVPYKFSSQNSKWRFGLVTCDPYWI